MWAFILSPVSDQSIRLSRLIKVFACDSLDSFGHKLSMWVTGYQCMFVSSKGHLVWFTQQLCYNHSVSPRFVLFISSPELHAPQMSLLYTHALASVVVRLSSVHIVQTSPEPLGQSTPNFMWSLNGKGKRKFVHGIWVTWPRWPPRPYMVKTLQNSSPEPVNLFPRNLVCNIGDSVPLSFVQMMTLC